MSTIKATKHFAMFKSLGGNRNINDCHLRMLTKSIEERNLLEYAPIIVNKKGEVIDGQHRLLAAKKLKTPVYYIVAEDIGLKEAQRLNIQNKNWTLDDYTDSYVKQGKEDYAKLKAFSEKFGFSISLSVSLLNNDSLRGNSSYLSEFKFGEFKIKDWDNGIKIATQLMALAPYCEPESIVRDRELVKSLLKAEEVIDFADIVNGLRIHGMKLSRHESQKDYLREIEDIYNFKKHGSNRIRLY
jgi:hypothetical protein